MRLLLGSEEHTSELQSPCNLVCRLLLEKKTTHASTCSARAPCSPRVPARRGAAAASPRAEALGPPTPTACPPRSLSCFFFPQAAPPPISPLPPPGPFPT